MTALARVSRSLLVPLLVPLLLLVAPAPTAGAEETVTVILKDGARYEDVTYRVRSQFSVLEMDDGDEVVNVSFADIQAIYDDDGNNVAPQILGRGYRPRAEEPEPPEPEPPDVESDAPPVAQKSARTERRPQVPKRGKPWSVSLALDGRGDLPFGDYYEGTDGGIGFGGTLHIRLSRDLALRGSVTRLGIDFGDDFYLVSYDPLVQIVSQDYQLDGTRYLAGLEYWKSLGGMPWGFWYVHSSLGAIRHELKGRAVVYDQLAGQTIGFSVSDTDTRFTQQSGVGVIVGISDRVGLVGSGDFDFVWTEVRDFGGGTSAGIKGVILAGSVGFAVRL